MIVTVTRRDLREEFAMAEEAFALSPISARASLPSEEDYAAISEAFMETSRGRWFLGEYAKRNRNADTSMVLDAVARIEQSLAAQRQATAEAETSLAEAALAEARLAEAKLAEAKLAEVRLVEVLAAIRASVEAAQAFAANAFDNLGLEQKLAPIRKGARVIREISWRLREIGNDGRICDIIDSQLAAIESGAAEISADEAKATLGAAFALISGRLAELDNDEAPAPVAEASAPEAAVDEATADEAPTAELPSAEIAVAEAVIAEVLEASPAPVPPQASPVVDPEPAVDSSPVPDVTEVAPALEAHAAPVTETAAAEAEAALAEAEIAEVAEVADEAAADAHDEALLDIVAMEMGAPDPFEADDMADMIAEEAHIEEVAPVEPEIIAQAPPLVVAAMEPPVEAPPQAKAERLPESLTHPPMEVSLGSSIIASGLVRQPRSAANDPLAPIRRMSQAERIAFFS